MLTVFHTLPPRFLDTPARELHHLLPGPTLIHLPGRRMRPLFVSVLLHGNEDSGWVALQRLLRRYERQPLPRALSVFVGNVAAAAAGVRRLVGQPDFNRVWPGADQYQGSPERALMVEVFERMREHDLFASIDVHNNTGINPHYGVVSGLDPAALHLALLFSRTVVWFRGLLGTQTTAFSRLCPALTIECGKAGNPANEAHAASFMDACLHLAAFPEHNVHEQDIDLYHTVATVRVVPETSFTFGERDADVCFDPQLDHMNFRELEPGTLFGSTQVARPLEVRDEQGGDRTAEFFACHDGKIYLRRLATPAMLTLDEQAVRQDCLCYLMERLGHPCQENLRRSLVGESQMSRPPGTGAVSMV